MNKIIIGMALLGVPALLQAQQPKDRPNIEKLCGCYNVEFKYVETFSPDPAYQYHKREEITGGTELILPIEVSDKKIVLQHLLVVSDNVVVKHWREDWTWEPTVKWNYQGDNVWTREALQPAQVKGKWMQTVWEVSDAPRYQGASEWVTTDGKTFWENTADAPLPRREYSVRSDYNVMKRNNRIVLTDSGWVHDQNNQKILRSGGKDKLLVEEKGVNTYWRTKDAACEAAKSYWEKNKDYWAKVRTAWDNYLQAHTTVNLKKEVNGKPLHDYLFQLSKDFAQGKVKPADIDNSIKGYLNDFIQPDKGVAQNQ